MNQYEIIQEMELQWHRELTVEERDLVVEAFRTGFRFCVESGGENES